MDLTQDSDEEDGLAEVVEPGAEFHSDQHEEEEEVQAVVDTNEVQPTGGAQATQVTDLEAQGEVAQQADEGAPDQEAEVRPVPDEARGAAQGPDVPTEDKRKKKKKDKRVVWNEGGVAPSSARQETAEAVVHAEQADQAEAGPPDGGVTTVFGAACIDVTVGVHPPDCFLPDLCLPDSLLSESPLPDPTRGG
ncbi:hypothetical protein R1sor_022963 [Riccia sorocarpa]|uniref:Uncharacterized protein n=1 Tax=Riccia sorocarpa TaxID=122646 RepID=A0ABD3GNE5_9MARC